MSRTRRYVSEGEVRQVADTVCRSCDFVYRGDTARLREIARNEFREMGIEPTPSQVGYAVKLGRASYGGVIRSTKAAIYGGDNG
jgi:hypothetical protein